MDDTQLMMQLTAKFARQPSLVRLNAMDAAEAERLAHALVDMKESFEKYLTTLLPKLDAADDASVMDCLQDVAEELRHVAYHMHDPKYFAIYVANPNPA